MKKEKRINNEDLTARDLTDEQVYKMAEGIVKYLFNKNPILSQAGWTYEDVLNSQFAYFYDKQSRGLQSPLTLKDNITQKHLKNLLFREFSLAIKYHIRSSKTQNELEKLESYSTDKTYDNSLSMLESVSYQLYEHGQILDKIKDVDNKLYDEYILSKLTEDSIKIDSLKQYKLKTNRKIIMNGNKIDYDDSECTYKNLTYRDLAKYYCRNYNNRKVTTTELKDLIIEIDEEGNLNQPEIKTIRKLMERFKEEVSNKIFNNRLGGELTW